MTQAKIYKPAKTAMQSGRGLTDNWVFEYVPSAPKGPENLMGWTAAQDTLGQVKLKFSSLEAAIKFAESKAIPYVVAKEQERKIKPRNYGDNFKYIETGDQTK